MLDVVPSPVRARPSRWRAGLALAALSAAALVGCGADDEPDTVVTTTTGAPAASTTAPPADPAATPDGAVIVAHRGASGAGPEHTFAAYDLAVEQGADYLEQDLQMTADGVLVVLHDDTLDRTARGPAESCTGPVREKTLDQLRSCDVGSWFNDAHPEAASPSYAGLRIPTMEEVLQRYGTDVRYYIETKSPGEQPGMEEALLELLDAAGLGRPVDGSRQVIIQSFSPESLRRFRTLRPELPLVQLLPRVPGPIDPSLLDEVADYAVGIGPSVANVDAALVAAAHERCLDVHPYTVDDPAEVTRLLDAGVDGLFTNMPDRTRQLRDDHAGPPGHCAPRLTG